MLAPARKAIMAPQKPASLTQVVVTITQLQPTMVPKPKAKISVRPKALEKVFLLFISESAI